MCMTMFARLVVMAVLNPESTARAQYRSKEQPPFRPRPEPSLLLHRHKNVAMMRT